MQTQPNAFAEDITNKCEITGRAACFMCIQGNQLASVVPQKWDSCVLI